MTVQEFERRMLAAAAAIEAGARAAIERAAVTIEREAKREIGHYQRAVGPMPRWQRLKPATLAEKTRLGHSPPVNPLLRTGEMRDSIAHSVSGPGEKIEARIGANGVVAVVQERGGGRGPARSYLERATKRREEAVVEMVRREIRRAFGMP